MGDSAEVKQNYLFDEIIEKGYDAEAFMNFMAEAKEGKIDFLLQREG